MFLDLSFFIGKVSLLYYTPKRGIMLIRGVKGIGITGAHIRKNWGHHPSFLEAKSYLMAERSYQEKWGTPPFLPKGKGWGPPFFLIVRCRQTLRPRNEQKAPKSAFSKQRKKPFQASLRASFFVLKTTSWFLFISGAESLARYRSHHSHSSCATCWHRWYWLFDCCYSGFCCKEA